jgi:exopolyphosphatase / guanosine-5'-triphosphate,3'-diphosphate pyrophosphatase
VLLSPEAIHGATVLGVGLRLAYTLSAGTPDLLAGTSLDVNHRLTLRLAEGSGVFAGESVTRRLDRLAQAMNLDATTELAA